MTSRGGSSEHVAIDSADRASRERLVIDDDDDDDGESHEFERS